VAHVEQREVQRPACIGLGLHPDRGPRPHRLAADSSLADGEPFLPIKPVDPVDPRWLGLPPQQDEQPAVAETPPLVGEIAQLAAQSTAKWWSCCGVGASAEDEPNKLILPLEHAYTPAELSFSALKGADAGVASVLVKAAAEADCDLHLALVSIEESGSAEHTGYYSRGRWGRDEEEDEEFEVAEATDRALILSEWRRPDCGEAKIDDFPFTEDELCPPDAFEDLTRKRRLPPGTP
jgi:hypothetical protein